MPQGHRPYTYPIGIALSLHSHSPKSSTFSPALCHPRTIQCPSFTLFSSTPSSLLAPPHLSFTGLAVGLDPEAYGNPDFCWLALHDSLVWSLAGPCAAALAVCTGLGTGEDRGSPVTLLTPCAPCASRLASSSWC